MTPEMCSSTNSPHRGQHCHCFHILPGLLGLLLLSGASGCIVRQFSQRARCLQGNRTTLHQHKQHQKQAGMQASCMTVSAVAAAIGLHSSTTCTRTAPCSCNQAPTTSTCCARGVNRAVASTCRRQTVAKPVEPFIMAGIMASKGQNAYVTYSSNNLSILSEQ